MLTGTGAAIILISLLVWYTQKRPLLILFTFFIPFSATAILNIAPLTFSVTPYHFFGGLLIATVCIGWLRHGVAEAEFDLSSPFFWMALFILFLMVWLFAAAATRGVTMTVLLQTALLLMGLLVTWTLSRTFDTPETVRLITVVYLASGIFVAVWGIIQWFCLNTGRPFPAEIFSNSISKGVNDEEILKNIGFTVYRMSSVTLEPSYFARFLAPATLVLVVLIGEGVGPRRPLVACLVVYTVAMLLSTSTIGYLGLALTGVVACALYARRLLPLLAGIGALTGAVLLAFPRALTAVLSVTVDKSESGSYEYRLWTMQQGYDAFATAPFFGHGWGWYAGGAVASVHDFLFKMLSSVGVVGLAIYMIFLVTCILQSLGALRALTNYRTGRTLPPALAAEAAQLRALLLGFSGAFCLIFVLDALATFSFFIGQQWFLLGAMVGMSYLTNRWIAQRVEADRLGQITGPAGSGEADPSGRGPAGGPGGGRRSAGGVGVAGAA